MIFVPGHTLVMMMNWTPEYEPLCLENVSKLGIQFFTLQQPRFLTASFKDFTKWKPDRYDHDPCSFSYTYHNHHWVLNKRYHKYPKNFHQFRFQTAKILLNNLCILSYTCHNDHWALNTYHSSLAGVKWLLLLLITKNHHYLPYFHSFEILVALQFTDFPLCTTGICLVHIFNKWLQNKRLGHKAKLGINFIISFSNFLNIYTPKNPIETIEPIKWDKSKGQ